MGPYSSQVGCGVVPPLTPPKMSPCSELPRPTVSPPRWLLQFPTEDGAYGYGATLPPELFEDNAADGDGGETRAGGFVRGWGLCEGLPPPPHSSPADEPLSPLCRRSCPGSQRPLHRLPLPLPGGWGQPAPGHRPLHRHPGEVSAEGGGHPGGAPPALSDLGLLSPPAGTSRRGGWARGGGPSPRARGSTRWCPWAPPAPAPHSAPPPCSRRPPPLRRGPFTSPTWTISSRASSRGGGRWQTPMGEAGGEGGGGPVLAALPAPPAPSPGSGARAAPAEWDRCHPYGEPTPGGGPKLGPRGGQLWGHGQAGVAGG